MIRIKDLDLLKNIDILFESEIVLYGAGDYGRRACELLKRIGRQILGFCDSNVIKWGEEIEGYKVMSLYEMADIKKRKQVMIIITMADCKRVEQVLEMLERYGMSDADCYTYLALQYTVMLHIEDNRIEETFREEEKIKEKLYCDYMVHRRDYKALSVLWSIISEGDSILVFQPGKVGSSTVYHSLEKAQVPCWHVHALTEKWRDNVLGKTKKKISLIHKVKKIRIISLIRDPIARGVSMYFQCFGNYIRRGDVYDYLEPDSYRGVISLLSGEIKEKPMGHMFEWFNMEIKDIFGIDVYQYDFDREKGYSIIRQDNVELLLLKLEKLNDCQDIIGQFAGVDNFKLIKSNVGTDKLCRFAYKELKSTIEIPQNILDFYYRNNLAMDHFYTSEEKKHFYRKWSKEE